MKSSKEQVRNRLTEGQKAQVRSLTDKDAEVAELSVEELEERIAPMTLKEPSALEYPNLK